MMTRAARAEIIGHIKSLPRNRQLTRADLLRPAFRIASTGDMEVYVAPVDHVNENARIVIAGITPGWVQMELAYRAAVEHAHLKLRWSELCRRTRGKAAFAGPMRKLLVEQLDEIGVAHELGLGTSAELFDGAGEVLHATSVLRYPVFVGGRNYTGHSPALIGTKMFEPYINDFAAEAAANSASPDRSSGQSRIGSP